MQTLQRHARRRAVLVGVALRLFSLRSFALGLFTFGLFALGLFASGGEGFAQTQPAPNTSSGTLAKAVFAGGCFWCTESDFDKIEGVISTTSGYTGGRVDQPSYEQVSAGGTGHAEAVEVVYDPNKVSYRRLVDYFWHTIDPTVKDAQFCDHGTQYRTAIFYQDAEQRRAAEASKEAADKAKPFKEPIVTEISMATKFWPAEEYHQDYHIKNPVRYKFYRTTCGRDARLKQLWGDLAGKEK